MRRKGRFNNWFMNSRVINIINVMIIYGFTRNNMFLVNVDM